MAERTPQRISPASAQIRFRLALNRILAGSAAGMALILLISLAVVILLVFALSKEPGRTLRYFFFGPLQNLYYFGNMINSAIPLMFGGLGVSIAMRSGNFNLGGEGQIYAGAFVAAITAIALESLGILGAILGILAGALFSGLIAGLSGVFKVQWNTNELITTFLISNALILITNYLVTGPFLDPDTNLQSTRKISGAFHLPQILPPSNLSAALLFAILAVVLVQLFLYSTRAGYEIRISGINLMFAKYGGVNTKGTMALAMFLSGALYGTGGGMAIYGTYFSVMREFSSGLGWNGLAVALIARSRPSLIIPAAIFFAWISSGARMAMQFSDVTFEIASIVQSVVFFLVTSVVLRDLFSKGRKL
ncbi:ABC transporter permease [Spirochaetia bacterium]|nr:ABC transporter permease [Spirochaetia bacterium]